MLRLLRLARFLSHDGVGVDARVSFRHHVTVHAVHIIADPAGLAHSLHFKRIDQSLYYPQLFHPRFGLCEEKRCVRPATLPEPFPLLEKILFNRQLVRLEHTLVSRHFITALIFLADLVNLIQLMPLFPSNRCLFIKLVTQLLPNLSASVSNVDMGVR